MTFVQNGGKSFTVEKKKSLMKGSGHSLVDHKWAIPEIRCIPPEDMGIIKILPTFFIIWKLTKKKKKKKKKKKLNHIFGGNSKEDMGDPRNFDHFLYKNGNFQFFTISDLKTKSRKFLNNF